MKDVIKFILATILTGLIFWFCFWLAVQFISAILRTVAVGAIMLICLAVICGN